MKSVLLIPIARCVLVGIFVLAPLRANAQHLSPPGIFPATPGTITNGTRFPASWHPPTNTAPGPLLPPFNTPSTPGANQTVPPQNPPVFSPTRTSLPASMTPGGISSDEKLVSVEFPHASVVDILTFYQQLTGKNIIQTELNGPELSIMVTNAIPQHEAISLIESALLLNGYTIIPVDDKSVKVLGPNHFPRAEGLPLYLEESELPQDGDKVVSFYKPLRFLGPDEATTILTTVIQFNTYGSIAPVANTGAIVITDKTPVIRKALALLDVVDQEPTQIVTEFIPLERANAETVVDTLNTIFGSGGTGSSGSSGTRFGGPPQGNQGAVTSQAGDVHLLSGKPQFIADKRTNRVLIVVKAENYKYLRELIGKLDQPAESDQPLIRPLNYISVNDIYPVLTDMLKSKDDTGSGQPGGQPAATPQPTPRQAQSSSGGTNSGTGDQLAEPTQTAPESTTLGSTSIITDPSANSIIVYGPPDTKAKAKEIIDILDQRPKQVYLAAVIGELQLTEGVNYGASWFAKISQGGSNNLVGAAVNNTISGLLTNLVSSGLTNAINSFPSSLAGLTVYGTVAQGLATYANFLESTGKFRTLSRPVVYTSNNKMAYISSGQQVPVPGTSTYNTVGAVGNNALNNVTSTVQYQNVALSLSVIPLINSDHEVSLQILQENNTLGAYVNIGGNSVPNLNTQQLQTTVRVPSGSTIVLGGLISDEKTISNAGIPYLSKIPLIGPLLGGQNSKSRTRSELVVMIQPIVVDDNPSMENASDAEGGISDLGKKSEELQAHLQPTPTPTPKKRFHLFSLPKIDNF